MREVCVSLATLPGLRTVEAARVAIAGPAGEGALSEPLFGTLSAKHVQLVPQNFGVIDERLCASLREAFPGTAFRLHANARVQKMHVMASLSSMNANWEWFERAAEISKRLAAPAYSAHSGQRGEASMREMLDNARRAADLFGVPVAVEGQYPTKHGGLLVDSWDEYREVFESGVPYALDLSHLNILATASGQRNEGLVREMLACERVIEVHVSSNDGRGDTHQVCEEPPWWFDLLKDVHPNAVIFSEGNHRRRAATEPRSEE